MKKIKITALVITVSFLLLFLIGCDFGGNSTTPTTQAPAITESPSATTDNQVTTDSPSNDKEPYVSVFSAYLVPKIIKNETLEKNILMPMREAINESVSILITEKATYRENEQPIGNYPFARDAGLIEVGKSYPYYDLIRLDNPDFDMAGPVVWTDSRPNGRFAFDHTDVRMLMQYYVLYNPFADGLTDNQISDMNTAYPITKEMAVYVLDGKAKKEEIIIRLETYIKTYVPSYTFEQLDKDHGEVGLGLAQIPIPDGVTRIENETFKNYSGLKNITIPESVTSIGDSAFAGCISLESIEIPSGVTYIGSGAFSGCTNLKYNEYDNAYYLGNSGNPYMVLIKAKSTDITACNIHEDTKIIHSGAFADCTSLKTVEFPKGLINVNFYKLFSGCTSLDNIEIPKIVTHIGDKAFYMCTSLKSIEIHSDVKSIGSYAFSGCSSLESIEIPASLSSIGDDVFSGCSSLTSVTIGNSVTSIGNSAFRGCSSLTSVTIGNSVTSIGYAAFEDCSSLTSINIPNSVTSIGGSAFSDCSSLTSITIPDGVTSIGYDAFSGCSSLTSINIPDRVTSIGSSAFKDCSSLTSITIGNGVTSIGYDAFSGCSSLTSVTIPDSVTSIGEDAFSGCSSLESITLPFVGRSIDTSNDVYQYLFGYIFGTSSYEGGVATTQYYYSVSNSSSINMTFYIPAALKSVTITGGNILRGAFSGCSSLTSINIPDSVTSIGERAFYNCSGLTSVTIGNSVTSIGEGAFSSCSSLTSVTIGNSVTSIGDDAFSGCYKLVEVYNRSSLSIVAGDSGNGYVASNALNVYTPTSGESKLHITDDGYIFYVDGDTVYLVAYNGTETALKLPENYEGKNYAINKYAFFKSSSLMSVTIPDSVTSIGYIAFSGCSSLTSVTIGNGVTSIGEGAFYSCSSLTSVTIPDSVTSIGSYAFSGCSRLDSISFSGTTEQWKAIEKGTDWVNYNVYCTNGYINKQ